MSATRKSLLLSFAEKYTLLLISMASSVVIARLLTPAQIGVFSVGAVVVGITHLVRDFGIAQYLIQEKSLSADKIRAAFTLTLLIAWAMAALLVTTSGLVGQFYGKPAVSAVLRVLALNCLLIPFGSVTLPILRRQLRFGAIYCINVASGLAELAAAIGLTLAGGGAISLAWAAVTGTGAAVLTSLFFRPADLPWRPSAAGVRQLLSFGTYATGSNVLDEAGVAAPDLIIGKAISLAGVGLFSKAQGVIGIFNLLITRAITPVILPLFSAQARDGLDMKQPYLKTIDYMAALAWPFFAVIGVLARPLVRLLYGPQWDASAALVQILCLSAATFSLFGMARDLFVAMGHVKKRAQLEAIATPLRILGIAVAAPFGLEAVAWSIVLTSVLKSLLIYRVLAQLTGLRLGELCIAVGKGAALTVLTIPAPLFVMHILPRDGGAALAPLALAILGAALSWFAGVFLVSHTLRLDIASMLYQLSRQWRDKAISR